MKFFLLFRMNAFRRSTTKASKLVRDSYSKKTDYAFSSDFFKITTDQGYTLGRTSWSAREGQDISPGRDQILLARN